MRVNELSANELEELKATLFYELLDNDTLEEVAPGVNFPEELTDELVFNRFGSMFFVPQDFWCNIEN